MSGPQAGLILTLKAGCFNNHEDANEVVRAELAAGRWTLGKSVEKNHRVQAASECGALHGIRPSMSRRRGAPRPPLGNCESGERWRKN